MLDFCVEYQKGTRGEGDYIALSFLEAGGHIHIAIPVNLWLAIKETVDEVLRKREGDKDHDNQT